MRYRTRWLAIFAAAATLVFESVALAPQGDALAERVGAPSGTPARYLVLERDETGQVRLLHQQLVELPSPLRSLSDVEMNRRVETPERDADNAGVSLVAVSGDVLYRDAVPVPRWLRGEFQGVAPGAPIDGHFIPLQRATFVARVPVAAGTFLAVEGAGIVGKQTLELASGGAQAGTAGLAGTIGPVGNPANRVDLLIMGDGYTQAQQSQFESDVANVGATFFNMTPYAEYRNFVNVHTLFTASPQSGADHPPYSAGCVAGDRSCCADPLMQSDPLRGTFVSTAFDAAYCSFNIHRLLTVNTAKVFAAASTIPDWDQIMVIVNDATYGGSGGPVSVVSTHAASVNIAQHEYGHSFTRLADEYDAPFPGYPPCSDVNLALQRCEANVN